MNVCKGHVLCSSYCKQTQKANINPNSLLQINQFMAYSLLTMSDFKTLIHWLLKIMRVSHIKHVYRIQILLQSTCNTKFQNLILAILLAISRSSSLAALTPLGSPSILMIGLFISSDGIFIATPVSFLILVTGNKITRSIV